MIVRASLLVVVAGLLVCGVGATGAPIAAQSAPAAEAARTDSVTEFRLRDGSTLLGRVVEESATRVVVETLGGLRVELTPEMIISRRVVRGRSEAGGFVRADPNATRLFFTSTARPLARGEGYVADYFLFLPMVAYGATDRLTIAGGTPIIFGMGEILYFAPKYTVVNHGPTALAIGALGFFATSHLSEGSAGIIYGVGTFGSSDNALTAGAGWGYVASSDGADVSKDPVLMLGGERRVGRSVKLITENWIFVGGDFGMASGGVRFLGDRLSADLGLLSSVTTEGTSCCFPLVNFVYTFGQRAP